VLPPFDFSRLFEVLGALSVITGAMAFPRRDTDEEDAMVAGAADVVLEALSDADFCRTTECITGRDLREQMTIEQAIALHEERELARYGKGRN
jgi:hypothetical protein